MTRKRRRKNSRKRSEEALRSVSEAIPHVATQHMVSPWLVEFVAQKFTWHSLFLETIETATSVINRNIDPSLFNAYLILGSRWFSHHEAIEMLLAGGRYGDCMVLLRSLLEDTDLMTYFSFFPKDSVEWTEKLGRSPDWTDEVYKQGIRKFRMPAIWRKLRDRGIQPLGQNHQAVLSATVHATPWGVQYFGRTLPGDPEHLYLSFAPTYDPVAAFTIALVLQETYPRPILAFLDNCKYSRVPKSEWRALEARYKAHEGNWRAKVDFDALFRQEIATTVERIAGGEQQEVVIEEVLARFKEKYQSMGHKVE